PDADRAKQLHDELARLRKREYQLQTVVYRQLERLETLGPARSWSYPFGSNPREVQAAQEGLEQAKNQQRNLAPQIQKAQSSMDAWQAGARAYRNWRDSEKGEQMHQCREILKLEPVRERMTQIHQVQEKERQKQVEIKALQGWRLMAIQLGRPDEYVRRIEEITEERGMDKPLTEHQLNYMKQDSAAYQERMRQVEVQKQRSPRIGGFGR
ncbi:MAG: hypothetical protein WCA35_02580, partial [Kovacikia sp.]